MIQEQRKMLEMMDSDQGAFDGYVNQMLDRLRGNAFGTFDGDMFQLQKDSIRTYWHERATEYIFNIEYKDGDNVDIDIKDGMITLKGMQIKEIKNEKGQVVNKSQSSFQRSVSIPALADTSNPEFKNEKNTIKIIFKKKGAKQNSAPKKDSGSDKQERKKILNLPGTKKKI